MKESGDSAILRYHNSNGRVWLTLNGRAIPPDLCRKILNSRPPDVKPFVDGQNFKVTTRGRVATALHQVEVQIEPLPLNNIKAIDLNTPPQTLNEWKQWLEGMVKVWPEDNLETLLPVVLNAQVFEFGDIDQDKLEREQERAVELHNKGFLKLPYECVIYRYTSNLYGRIHLITRQEDVMIQHGGPHVEGQTDHFVWPLTLIINTKGVEIRREVPSAKLQAKRAARGKSPLPYVTYVKADKYYVAVSNTEHKNTHASPCPHLRRGHLREYKSGHTVWIKDMLVNCTSLADVAPRKEYRYIKELA